MLKSQDLSPNLPKHLGFIVDGNRRWARERGLPTLEGHRKGFKKVELVVESLAKLKIPFMTFYLFSTENWNRSPEEIAYLMELIRKRISKLTEKLQKLDLKCQILGRPNKVDPELWEKLQKTVEKTKDNKSGVIGICFNYGGHQEIIDAINDLPKESIGSLTASDFEKYLYAPEIPPVDMIIRTSGEQRISGFMLWRASYSEMLFLDKFFPDIKEQDLEEIIQIYNKRQRRFGH